MDSICFCGLIRPLILKSYYNLTLLCCSWESLEIIIITLEPAIELSSFYLRPLEMYFFKMEIFISILVSRLDSLLQEAWNKDDYHNTRWEVFLLKRDTYFSYLIF